MPDLDGLQVPPWRLFVSHCRARCAFVRLLPTFQNEHLILNYERGGSMKSQSNRTNYKNFAWGEAPVRQEDAVPKPNTKSNRLKLEPLEQRATPNVAWGE
jgi:hypothetical protein